MVLIDTHLHLSSPDYKEDIEAVISRAKTSNVKYFITIGSGYGADNFLSTIEISKKYNLFFALGVHPHDADMGLKIASPNSIYYEKTDEILQKIREASKNIRMVGIGEIGLDYYYEYSNKKIQRETFARFVDFSSSIDMPVIIHSRDAFSDTLDIIKSNRNGTKGVFHCFSYNLEMAKAVLDMGFYISIPGIVTFKKSTDMQGVTRYIPEDRILVETDAPFLAPVPYRGKRNEPSFIVETYKTVASIRGTTVEELSHIVLKNAISCFRIRKEDLVDTD